MATRRPARLAQNRHGTFCLRWIVPKRLRDAQRKPTEVRVSLRTRDLQRARILAMEVNLAFERLRAVSSQIDPRDLLQQMNMQVGRVKFEIKDEKDLALLGALFKDHPELKDKFMDALQPKDGAAPAVDDLVRSLAAAVVSATGSPQAGSAVVPVLLIDAIDKFTDNRAVLAKNRRSTATEKRRTLDLLLEYLKRGRIDTSKMFVHELGRRVLLDFVSAYSNRDGKAKAEADANKLEAVKKDPATKSKGGRPPKSPEGLASQTITKAIGHLDEFCVYAVAASMMASNPIDQNFNDSIEGLRKSASQERKGNNYLPFSACELRLIFDPESLLAENSKADYFWCPLLGLYSAARLGELVTLSTDDVHVDPESGVLVLRIEERDEDDRKVKNQKSIRSVPVAQQLVDLGFTDYVDHVRGLGGTMVFPHLRPGATREDGPSKNQSRRFSEYLTKLKLTNPRLVFHSFRHTGINTMLGRGVPMMDSELIAGHAAQDAILARERIPGAMQRSRGSTQQSTYSTPEKFFEPGEPMMARLKRHIDSTLFFDLDHAGLACAAEIVRQNTTASTVGTKKVFKSGWNRNAKNHSQEMLGLLKACRSKTTAG